MKRLRVLLQHLLLVLEQLLLGRAVLEEEAQHVRVLEHSPALDDLLVGGAKALHVQHGRLLRLLHLAHAPLGDGPLVGRKLEGRVVSVEALVIVKIALELGLGTLRLRLAWKRGGEEREGAGERPKATQREGREEEKEGRGVGHSLEPLALEPSYLLHL